MKSETAEGFVIVASMLLFFFLGVVCCGSSYSKIVKEYRQKAIDGGAAHYDEKTGEFTWNQTEKESK